MADPDTFPEDTNGGSMWDENHAFLSPWYSLAEKFKPLMTQVL